VKARPEKKKRKEIREKGKKEREKGKKKEPPSPPHSCSIFSQMQEGEKKTEGEARKKKKGKKERWGRSKGRSFLPIMEKEAQLENRKKKKDVAFSTTILFPCK